MNYSRFLPTGTLIIFLLSFAHTATAQTTPAPFGGRGNITEEDIYRPPEAYVLSATANVQEDRTVQGTITFWNKSDEILSDMTYVIDLLGELPAATTSDAVVEDNTPVYDTVPSEERFVLIGNEEKTIPYTYTPPKNLPAGNYRVEITVATGRGRTMGWFTVPVRFSEENTAFTQIVPGKIAIAEYGDQTFDPETGPNVDANKSVTISALASSETTRLVAPVLDVYTFSTSRQLLRSIRGSTVNADQDGTPLTMTIPTLSDPGVYIGVLSLRDPATNERISNLAKYRWVVRGKDADVLYARMTSYGSNENDTISFSIDYVGAGDAETKTNGTIAIDLHDDAGSIETFSAPNTTLDDKIRTGEITLALSRNLVGNPTLDIAIQAEDGTTLTSYSVPFPFTAEQLRTVKKDKVLSRVLLYGGGILIILGTGMLAITHIRKKRRKRKN